MPSFIQKIADLEACIGKPSLGVKMKVIDHIDETASDWINKSRLAFVGWQTPEGPDITLTGGDEFASVEGKEYINLSKAALDNASQFYETKGIGLLFLAKGTGETLRVNGRISNVSATHVQMKVEECFVHCAKALMRSEFWRGQAASSSLDAQSLLNEARFLAYVTMDKSGRIDISPKGDPSGALLRVIDNDLMLPERPGNKLAFGFRNIIEQSTVAGLAIMPGGSSIASFRGKAKLTNDPALRETFAVEGKTPKLVTQIVVHRSKAYNSAVLRTATPWSDASKAPEIDPAAAIVAHIKLNKESGVQATMVRMAVTRGVVGKGLKDNYKSEMY